jgi:hypothetical protein
MTSKKQFGETRSLLWIDCVVLVKGVTTVTIQTDAQAELQE